MFLTLTACGGSSAPVETPEGFRTITTSSFFDIDVPVDMKADSELNDQAEIQFSYISEEAGTTKELYMIVIMETKEEIESYDLDMEFDALSYGDISAANLEGGLDSYEILTKNAKIETINGIDCAKYEMEGSLGAVGVYYKLGVFEGKKAFYQVLTWTLTSQKAEFKEDMDKMINSFREK